VGSWLSTAVGWAEGPTLEAWLAGTFGADPAYGLSGDRLRLAGGGITIDLVDIRSAPDRPLQATVWKLRDILLPPGDEAQSVAGLGLVTLVFDESVAQMEIAFGNTGTTHVQIDGGHIRFDTWQVADRGCGGAVLQAQAAVLAVLTGDITAEVTGTTLELRQPGGHGLRFIAADVDAGLAPVGSAAAQGWPAVATTAPPTTTTFPPPPTYPTTMPLPPPPVPTTQSPPGPQPTSPTITTNAAGCRS
jgi:hypothetical protein